MKCSFCATELPPGTGIKHFQRDGSALIYCSRKCERNAAMGRKPAKLKWAHAKATPAPAKPAKA